HAVGPVYRDGKQGEPELLASAYTRALELAVKHDLKTVALPSISTGAYGYPMEEAARISLGITFEFVGRHSELELLRFVLWDAAALETYEMVFSELAPTQGPGDL
ncbi:MAG: macro domain-containing protein, partial [Acidobacteriota bacterium]|nr:macro domain-containing protein [Acidobacteriota bacterium]